MILPISESDLLFDQESETSATEDPGGVLTKNNTNRCYAGHPGITYSDIFNCTADFTEKETFHGRQVVYTHKGRSGLGLLCHHWNLQSGDEILMPSYNCGTEIDPFVYHGLKVIFYRVDQQAQLDLEDLQSRVTAKSRMIYVTHYFGWPHDIRYLSNYCKENNLYLLEDCALSIFSNPLDSLIGILGDAAIYSFPKTLPVPDGGALTLASSAPPTVQLIETPHANVILKEMLPLIKRTVLRFSDKVGLYKHLPQRFIRSRARDNGATTTSAGFPEIPQSYYFDKTIEKKSASWITRYILNHSCPTDIVQRRRAHYAQLFEAACNTKIFQPLFYHLPEGVCPLWLPVIVEDREAACYGLNERGIAATQWWAGYHRAFDWSEFPEARYLKDQVLTIPIHQQLSPRDVEYICSAILSVGNGQF
ncbi:DegT/DnrJ/EryC1/StrS aminotransferase family protein [Candidatus Roizmanbacteria bacterium]|nr:DegT/DnrJ/EryC1/StrS aminotransferase family protein [Candidatus Roizmanbacteria bacterium]